MKEHHACRCLSFQYHGFISLIKGRISFQLSKFLFIQLPVMRGEIPGLEKSQQNRKENHLMTAEGRTEDPALRCGASYQGQLVSLKHMAGILVSGKPRGWKII